MKILITSGGCKVPIDEVRHIGNFSSGRYGSAIADSFLKAGHEVVFFYEKGSVVPEANLGINKIPYKDYFEYLTVKDLIAAEQPDIIISAAAISDYICDKFEGKFSSNSDTFTLQLRKAEKVLSSFRELAPNAMIVGFKCLVGEPNGEQMAIALDKVLKAADVVVYNNLTRLREGKTGRTVFRNRNGQSVIAGCGCDVFQAPTPEDLVDILLSLKK